MRRIAAALIAVAVTLPVIAGAQVRPTAEPEDDFRRATPLPQWELRVEGVAASEPSGIVAAGVNWRAGWYARPVLTAGLGQIQRDGRPSESVLRLDGAVRFHLDPFAERLRGVYGGIGASWSLPLRDAVGSAREPVLSAQVGIEGKKGPKRVWAAELGLGGGLRFALVLRQARRGPAR